MPTISIADVRQKYPQYNDLSDTQLADALHGKFYSDMPRDSFNQRIGLAPQAEDVGRGTALKEGALSGVSANFRDEIYGLSEASGLPAALGGFRAPVGAARMAYESLTGNPGDATQAYERGVEEKRAVQKTAQEQYPGTYLAGEVGGAVALPGGALIRGATLPARVAQSAAVGTGYGAAYGAGAGETPDERLTGAASGAALGGVAGAVAPAALAGAEAIARGVKASALPILGTIRGVRNPETEAATRVTRAIGRDIEAGAAGLSPREFATQGAQGAPVSLLDLGGETTRALARSAANTSPEGRAVLQKVIDDRFEGQGDRTAEFVRSLVMTPANASRTREALEQTARNARKPFYDRAYAQGSGGIWNANLASLAEAPAVTDAMKAAVKTMQNRAASGRAQPPQASSGAPTLAYWDAVKQNLDDKINSAKRAGERGLSADLTALKTQLVSELDSAVPSYAMARGVAAELFKATDALDAGEKFVTSSMKNNEARAAIARMSAEERDLFAEGFASRLVAKIEEGGDRRNVLNQIATSKAARERIEIALGANKARELEAHLRIEGILDLARGAMGNSTTARQLAELGLAGGVYGSAGAYSLYTGDPQGAIYAALLYGARAGKAKIDQKVARRVAELLASNDPAALKRGLQIVSRNSRLFDALRNADASLTRISAQQTSDLMIPQGSAPTRAEDQQPE